MQDLEGALFYQLTCAYTETRQAFAQSIGMNQARYHLLTVLALQGETSHAALQQQLALDGATVTRLVKQFEAEGAVSRRLDPQDNRYTLVSLTPAGKQVVAGLGEAHKAFQTRLLAGIPQEELAMMVRVLEQLRANIHTLSQD